MHEEPVPPAVPWSAFDDAAVRAFADAVIGVGRELARAVPAPRGAPLFGLDMTVADPGWLDRFSRHGIFRKYQRAVAFDGGFGGVARWWTMHFGCSVLGVDPHPGVCDAAQRLGEACGLTQRATFRCAPLHNLPVRAEQFTHAWSVEGIAALDDPLPALREALRVLRPSGMLGLIVGGRAVDDPAVKRWADRIAHAGFLAVVARPLPPPELPYTIYYAEHVLRAALAATTGDDARRHLLRLAAELDAARASRAPRVMLYAEKPS